MHFSYIAKDNTGTESRGTIEAANKLEAADALFTQRGLTVVQIDKVDSPDTPASQATPTPPVPQQAADNKGRLHIGSMQKDATDEQKKKHGFSSLQELVDYLNDITVELNTVSTKDKVIFFRLLSAMINAGMPIVKSLSTLVNHTENPKLKKVLTDVADTVERGGSFSGALGQYDTIFTQAEIGVITTGEQSGQLNVALQDLATQAEKHASMTRKIKSAMIYPATVLIILVGVFVVVMTTVIPTLSELFAGMGGELPAATQFMIATSEWFLSAPLVVPNWLLFVLAFPAAFFGVKTWRETENGRVLFDRIMLSMPIIGELSKKVALATFTRQLSTLTNAGVSIIRSLEIAAHALSNEAYRRRLLEAKEDVEKGVPIHKAIGDDHKLFPELMVSMVAVGEQTAQLGTTSKKVAEFYDEEVDTFVGNLSTIMEPVVIVLVGVLVGGLVVAIMQPIMNLADIAAVS